MSSATGLFAPFYEPIQSKRFFSKDQLYSSINWDNFRDVLNAWKQRIFGWYIEPIKVMLDRDLHGWRQRIVQLLTKRSSPAHFAFSVMSTTCLLIDALSQYRYGKLSSKGEFFMSFVEDFLPSYNGLLPSEIWHYEHKYAKNGKKLTKYSEVLWYGYRCGILHQAHAPLYCGVVPGNSLPIFETVNHTKYGNGATNPNSIIGKDCPLTNICPEHLFDEVMTFLAAYWKDLADPNPEHDDSNNGIRTLFKRKFSDIFGIDITAAKL